MRADSGGVGIDYSVTGDGRPVILLHGFPDSRQLWDAQVEALAGAGFKVITPDLRGYGASDKPDDPNAYAIPFLAGDVLAVLDAEGVEQAHVVGHDWGAALAWATASLVPDRVDHLVALSVGNPQAFAAAGLEQREKSWYMLLFQFVDVAEQWLSNDDWKNFREWSSHPDADNVVATIEKNGSLTPALNYYRANIPPAALLGPPMELPPVQANTMGVWSSGDMALTEAQMQDSSAFVSGTWRYERLEGPGHWMQLEAPDAVNALLLDFLPT